MFASSDLFDVQGGGAGSGGAQPTGGGGAPQGGTTQTLTRPLSARRGRPGSSQGNQAMMAGGGPAGHVGQPNAGRMEYTPSASSGAPMQRPQSAAEPEAMLVRPVSARTFGRSLAGAGPAQRGGAVGRSNDQFSLYNNTMYGTDEGADDDNPLRSGTVDAGAGAGDVGMSRLAQQREMAAQRRRERMMAHGPVANNTAVSVRPPSSGGMRPPSAGVSRPGVQRPTSGRGGALTSSLGTLSTTLGGEPAAATRAPVQFTGGADTLLSQGGINRSPPPKAQEHPRAAQSAQAAELERNLGSMGLSAEFDPTMESGPNFAAQPGRGGMGSAQADASSVPRAPAAAAAASQSAKQPYPPANEDIGTISEIDLTDMRSFLMRPGLQNKPVQCYINRDVSSKMYPKYSLFLSDDEGDRFLLSARKRKKSKTSNYLISLSEEDQARDSGNYFGKLRSNFVGTEFIIYDRGHKPGENPDNASTQLRSELGCVFYQYNVLGTRGPRKMTALVPKVNSENRRAVFRPETEDEGMLERYKSKQDMRDLILLKNKPPKWNEQLGAYCLNFNGRVTHASVKNFQLVDENDLDRVILQFGKVGKDSFTMDFQWPLCALQAFAICLTSFDNKLACE